MIKKRKTILFGTIREKRITQACQDGMMATILWKSNHFVPYKSTFNNLRLSSKLTTQLTGGPEVKVVSVVVAIR